MVPRGRVITDLLIVAVVMRLKKKHSPFASIFLFSALNSQLRRDPLFRIFFTVHLRKVK